MSISFNHPLPEVQGLPELKFQPWLFNLQSLCSQLLRSREVGLNYSELNWHLPFLGFIGVSVNSHSLTLKAQNNLRAYYSRPRDSGNCHLRAGWELGRKQVLLGSDHFAVHLKLIQHCKSTILQNKIKIRATFPVVQCLRPHASMARSAQFHSWAGNWDLICCVVCTKIKTKPPKSKVLCVPLFNFEILKEMNFHCFSLLDESFPPTCWVSISELLGDVKQKMLLMYKYSAFSPLVWERKKCWCFHRRRQCCVCRLNPPSVWACWLHYQRGRREETKGWILSNIPGCFESLKNVQNT